MRKETVAEHIPEHKTASPANQQVYYTPQMLAEMWQCCIETVYDLLRQGKLKGFSAHGGYQYSTPKNNKPRIVMLPDIAVTALRRQRAKQSEMRLAAGPIWSNPDNLVFTMPTGEHIKHDLVYRHLKRIFASMGVPDLRFHDLRHSYAVLSLQSGCDIKTVQENLGHHAAAFTLDTYAHVTEQMRREGAEKINRFMDNLGVG